MFVAMQPGKPAIIEQNDIIELTYFLERRVGRVLRYTNLFLAVFAVLLFGALALFVVPAPSPRFYINQAYGDEYFVGNGCWQKSYRVTHCT